MTDIPPSELSQPETSTSAPPRQLCGVCNHRYSIYTCPGCTARTCSLPCSTNHKSSTGCTGVRNKAAYVPMNKYGWGTMMDDYVFLEDVGRRVGDWGKQIVRGGFGMRGSASARGRGVDTRNRGARGRGRPALSGGGTKRDVLKVQLEARDIDMELLPVGMERRKINQSYWEPKSHTAFLTVEFKFHPPRDPHAPSSQPPGPPFVLLTHRNSMNMPLLSLIQTVTARAQSKRENPSPTWVKHFVAPDPDDPESFTAPQCVMTAQLNPHSAILPGARGRAAYYRFDPAKTLAVLLRYTHFVEFPTIDLWEEFSGTVVDVKGAVTQQPADDERRPKRRKLATKAGKKAIDGLLGGYGSDGDEEKAAPNVLSLLDGYAGSDDEGDGSNKGVSGDDEDAEGETDDEIEVELDPAALLELMRQAQGEKWVENIGGDDDTVDWGDSGEE